ncbi:hypothetical protein J6590_026130 [Homalodisca vitripennis]|nr:hypothetical protein J6590_026130 [Homalodisca vitripennis]
MLETVCDCKPLNCQTLCCTPTQPYCCWKQVEFNTIASGFGWLGPASGLIHSVSVWPCYARTISHNPPKTT